jgi:hypothetical protein
VKIDYDTPPRSSTRRIAFAARKKAKPANCCRASSVKIVRYGFGARDG